jgi:hypothetical protein
VKREQVCINPKTSDNKSSSELQGELVVGVLLAGF